jgi:hypothetical protein
MMRGGMADQLSRVMDILGEAKKLAQEYPTLTGKPLGVTGEVSEYEAARLLHLELTPARNEGFDAIERVNAEVRKLQIKGRCLQPHGRPGQRLGRIDKNKEWDAILMVLLDENLEATEIYEADREPVLAALSASDAKSLKRGQLGVSKIRAIGRLRWRRGQIEPRPSS